jgi:hypothetical protein
MEQKASSSSSLLMEPIYFGPSPVLIEPNQRPVSLRSITIYIPQSRLNIQNSLIHLKLRLRLNCRRWSVDQSLGVWPSFGAHDQFFLIFSSSESFLIVRWGALSDDRTRLQFALQSIIGPGRSWPMTILRCLIGDCTSCTPLYWVPFLSPLTTRRNYGRGTLTRLHTCIFRINILHSFWPH